jgi:hypothetical protein
VKEHFSMASSDDPRMQLAVAQMNVDVARRHIEDADTRMQDLQEKMARGEAPADAEQTLVAIAVTRSGYLNSLLSWGPEVQRLQELVRSQN